MPRKSFHLKWNNHLQNLQSLFENIFDEQTLVDVTISCSDGVLYGHKLVLSACSPYFEQVFKDNPCKHPIIILKGVSKRDMRLLLEYMYKGSVDVGEEDLEMMLDTATELQIKGLVQTSESTTESTHQKSDESLSFKEHLPSTKLTSSPITQHCDSLIWQAELVAKPSSSKLKESEIKQLIKVEQNSDKCSSVLNSDTVIHKHKESKRDDESVFSQHGILLKTEKECEEMYEQEDDDYIPSDAFDESQETMQTNHFQDNEPSDAVDFNWVCHICSRRFQSKNSYQRHMLTHAGVKPHHCTFCNQSFLRLSHLQRHVRVHTGERPYACAQCPKQFARSDKLRQHCVIQHSHIAGPKVSKPRGRPRKHFTGLNPPLATSTSGTTCNSTYSVSINPIPMSAV